MPDRRGALAAEYAAYGNAKRAGNHNAAWQHLARAHILAQPHMVDHFIVHIRMIAFALTVSDWAELRGQAIRLILAPIGNLSGRLPIGNTGLSNVSAFRPMPIHDDLAVFLTPPKAG